jgi:hypothetical protein
VLKEWVLEVENVFLLMFHVIGIVDDIVHSVGSVVNTWSGMDLTTTGKFRPTDVEQQHHQRTERKK